MKVKETANEAWATTKRIVNNLETFVQASALLTLAVFSYNQLHKANLPIWGQWLITAALVIVALRAAYEYYRFLEK